MQADHPVMQPRYKSITERWGPVDVYYYEGPDNTGCVSEETAELLDCSMGLFLVAGASSQPQRMDHRRVSGVQPQVPLGWSP